MFPGTSTRASPPERFDFGSSRWSSSLQWLSVHRTTSSSMTLSRNQWSSHWEWKEVKSKVTSSVLGTRLSLLNSVTCQDRQMDVDGAGMVGLIDDVPFQHWRGQAQRTIQEEDRTGRRIGANTIPISSMNGRMRAEFRRTSNVRSVQNMNCPPNMVPKKKNPRSDVSERDQTTELSLDA